MRFCASEVQELCTLAGPLRALPPNRPDSSVCCRQGACVRPHAHHDAATAAFHTAGTACLTRETLGSIQTWLTAHPDVVNPDELRAALQLSAAASSSADAQLVVLAPRLLRLVGKAAVLLVMSVLARLLMPDDANRQRLLTDPGDCLPACCLGKSSHTQVIYEMNWWCRSLGLPCLPLYVHEVPGCMLDRVCGSVQRRAKLKPLVACRTRSTL